MPRKTYQGSGTLPGIGEELRPAPAPRPRPAPPHDEEISAGRIVFIVTTIAAVLLGSLYGFHRLEQFLIRDPRFALNGPDGSDGTATLEISGAKHASASAVRAVFNDDSGRSVYLLPLNDRRATLCAVDWVKDASIVRLWPNRIIVRISERVPVAFVTLAASKFALIDEDGVILPPARDRFTLPVLAGVRSSDPLSERRDRVHRMLRLTRDLGEMAANISEIDASDPDNLKITQSWEGRVVILLLGDHDFSLRYQNFVRNYPEIKRRLPGAATLDMRLEDRITVVE